MGKRSWAKMIALSCLALAGASAAATVPVGLGWVTAFSRTRTTPPPPIQRDGSPEAIARGEKLFRQVCGFCHIGEDGRASGKPLADYPAFLGKFYSRNITSDPEAGVGAWSDQEIARMILHGIDRTGHATAMTAYPRMGEDDVAAIIGFMRSSDPIFEPVKARQPPRQVSFIGNLVITLLSPESPAPKPGTKVPRIEASAEYGAYLANDVLHCVGCHTPGFVPADAKIGRPDIYGGGFEFDAAGGGKVVSANITLDPTGIGAWSAEQFVEAVQNGITKDGYVLRFPMPQYRWMDDLDLRAIYAYLATVPKIARVATDAASRPKATADADPEQMFRSFGCIACHGPGAPFRDKLVRGAKKEVGELAKWIRDAPSVRPGVQMPSFSELIDEPRATALAAWVQNYARRP
jgi:mono/diheme cytochrome c family protein